MANAGSSRVFQKLRELAYKAGFVDMKDVPTLKNGVDRELKNIELAFYKVTEDLTNIHETLAAGGGSTGGGVTKAYVDTQDQDTLARAMADSTSKDTAILAEAKAYTDAHSGGGSTSGVTKDYVDTQDGVTLTAANNHSDQNDASTLEAAKAYADSLVGTGGNSGSFGRIGSVEWFNGTRANMPADYIAADGELINRTAYPKLWDMVQTTKLLSVTDALWLNSGISTNTVMNRGKYSLGDGTTTFRVPDLNGVQTNSVQSLFLRGSPASAEGNIGHVVSNAAPNITGTLAGVMTDVNGKEAGTGAFHATSASQFLALHGTSSQPFGSLYAGTFDASRSNPSYGRDGSTEVRPNNATGIWIIRVQQTPLTPHTETVMVDLVPTGTTIDTAAHIEDTAVAVTLRGTNNKGGVQLPAGARVGQKISVISDATGISIYPPSSASAIFGNKAGTAVLTSGKGWMFTKMSQTLWIGIKGAQ